MKSDAEDPFDALEAALEGRADRASGLVGIAELAARGKATVRAFELARAAIAQSGGDPVVVARARAVLGGLIPGYHVPMMNDTRRNAAWDKALRAAIKPGMEVFEIGTGAGMLALMAARAGAAKVVTCERNPLVARLARELVAHNGYAGRIEVIEDKSQNVRLPRRADLLFCDIFADDLFDFDPLLLIRDARERLLVPGAPVVPNAVSLHVALAHWNDYGRALHLETAAGFDMAAVADIAAARKGVPVGDPGLTTLSAAQTLFRFDLQQYGPALAGTGSATCTAARAGTINGIARWIRLDLGGNVVLEAAPEPGARYFSNIIFIPLPAPRLVAAGESLRVESRYDGMHISTWLAG